jgi:F0F1-type ATP synthase membrane subunit c/vacuolar-type H+-ATPase subunit K
VPSNDPANTRRPNEGTQPSEIGPGEQDGQRPKFFLGVYESSLRGSRIYRVYPDQDGMLFIFAGPMIVWIDVEMVRRIDPTHWTIKAAGVLRTGLVACVGVALVVGAVLFRVVSRAARHDPTYAGDLITLFVTTAIFSVAFIIFAVTVSVRRIMTRVAYLDALTEDGLRQEAGRDKWSFRVSAEDVSDVCFDRLEKEDVLRAPQGGRAARLSFTHAGTGKWKLNLVKPKDTKAAVRAFRRLVGPDAVEVNFRLKEE